jgi:hypothetical protein
MKVGAFVHPCTGVEGQESDREISYAPSIISSSYMSKSAFPFINRGLSGVHYLPLTRSITFFSLLDLRDDRI